MLSLYQMSGAVVGLRDAIENEDLSPEQREQAEDAVGRLLDEWIPEKVVNYVGFMRSLDAEAAAFKDEERRLHDRRTALENTAKRLHERLFAAMEACDLSKLKAGTFTLSVQNSPPGVDVPWPPAIPVEYLIPQEPKVDKAAILKVLKAGGTVDGASLRQGRHLRIR